MKSLKQVRAYFTLLGVAFGAVALLAAAPLAAAEDADIPRTASGRPDLTGTYDIATLTPLERDPKFSDNLYLSPEESGGDRERGRHAQGGCAGGKRPDSRSAAPGR